MTHHSPSLEPKDLAPKELAPKDLVSPDITEQPTHDLPRGIWLGVMVFSLFLSTALAVGQDQADESSNSSSTPPAAPAVVQEEAASPTAEDIMRDLLEEREAPPVIAPVNAPDDDTPPEVRIGLPTTKVDLDPAVLGVAPGSAAPQLRREGEFVVSRKGRLVRASQGGYSVFLFESDNAVAPEPPMILQPCRLLEDMENYVDKHGDQVVFLLSGQVHVYRGINYVLPTMMKIHIDKGNL